MKWLYRDVYQAQRYWQHNLKLRKFGCVLGGWYLPQPTVERTNNSAQLQGSVVLLLI
jgi:hypothetical protein